MATRKHSGNQGGTAKTAGNSEIFVGRAGSSNLDIEINSDVVSGKHLKIMKIGTMVILEDLGSTNGTKIDGVTVIAGEQKPITLNSKVLLADKEILDLNHPQLQPFFEGVPASSGAGTMKQSTGGGVTPNISTPPPPSSRDPLPQYDKFYPPGYMLEEEKHCQGERENIVIRIFSKDNKLRAIIFGEESQNLIFNEEQTFESQMDNLRDADEKRRFLKQEIQNFLHLHKERYCREEIWHLVLTSDGKYKDGGFYKLVSEKFENRLKTKVYINDKHYKDEEERLEYEDADLINIRAKEVHVELATQYQEKEAEAEFPVSVGWLDAIIQKFPQYSKKPMYAFYWFILSIIVLFLVATYISGGFTPKITDKNVDKKWIKHPYYAYIVEPLWGRLTDDCIAGSEAGWLKADGKKKDNKFKKQCMNYCHRKVSIINRDTCKILFGNLITDSTITDVKRQPYQIIPPSESIGSSTTSGIILFMNNTDSDIIIELDSIKVDDQDLPGIVFPISGKTKFVLESGEQGYRYDIMFESSAIGQLQKGQHKCDIGFKVTQKGEEPHIKPIHFNLDI